MEQMTPAREPRRLADFLRARHDEILARWEREVSRLRPARFLSRPALLDHIPDFLRQLSDYVSATRDGVAVVPPQEFPIVHAIERLDVGYDLDEVVAEYAVLRECVTTVAYSEGAPARLSAELPVLHKAIDQAIAASVERYSKTRERTLKALDRISTAALGVREIEAFLPRTLNALLETTPSIDSASILVVQDGRLHVKAAAGNALQPGSAPALARGESLAGQVWETQRPQAVTDAQTDPRVTSDIIHRHGTRAMYGVPLHFGTELIGVALIGSSSASEFSHDDQLFFRTAVNRMAALVAQARLDDAVRRQNAMNESILSALGDLGEGFAVVEDERPMSVNDTLCEILARTREEILALPSVLELVVPEQRESLREILFRRLDESAKGRIETTLLRKNGGRIDAELGVKRKHTGRVVIVVRDVTERKALERERREQRARLETVLRILPVGVTIAEAPSGKFILRNNEADRVWGQVKDPRTVEEYQAFEGYWPDGRRLDAGEWPLARAVRSGQVTPPEEIVVIASDGTRRIVEHEAAPVRDSAGSVVAGVVTHVDVTDRKRNEEELRAALAFRDQILNVLAHDLRQPLSVVRTSAELLLRKEEMKPQAPTVQRVLRNVERMDRLIADLLDFARARPGSNMPLERKRIDLCATLQQAIDGLQTLHPDRQIVVDRRGSCAGLFDADRMLQVFGNLLGNAIAYSPDGSPIDVVLEEDEKTIVFRVHNRGPPIPADRLPTIFEPFRRGTSAANRSGLGLGLFIVRQIVFAHGGTVTVASSEAEGTTFSVRLPKS
ncbi:MAG: ATP-binding protein [Myxococcales bacterium]